MSKAKELLELLETVQMQRTSTDGKRPHYHHADIDADGNGKTVTSQQGGRHFHRIVSGEVMPPEDTDAVDPKHVHTIIGQKV